MKDQGDKSKAGTDEFLQELDSLMQLLAAQRRERAAAAGARTESGPDKGQRAAFARHSRADKPNKPSRPMTDSPHLGKTKTSRPALGGENKDQPTDNIPVLRHKASQALPTLTNKVSGSSGKEIPVLSEVVAKGTGIDGKQPPSGKSGDVTPSQAELETLVEMLLERKLEELKPTLRGEIVEQVKRLFPLK